MLDVNDLKKQIGFDENCMTCYQMAEEVEFYCRTCQVAICRNCLLKNHLNLNFGPGSQE